MISRERDHVRKFLSPTTFIYEWLIKCVLARCSYLDTHKCNKKVRTIEMHPALPAVEPDLCPHVVRPVEHVARLKAHCAAAEREAVGPLAASAAARLEKLAGIAVPDESDRLGACAAAVHLDAVAAVEEVFGGGESAADGIARAAAKVARRGIDPGEELVLEPAHQLAGKLLAEIAALGARAALEALNGDDRESSRLKGRRLVGARSRAAALKLRLHADDPGGNNKGVSAFESQRSNQTRNQAKSEHNQNMYVH